MSDLLQKLNIMPFKPLPFLTNGTRQTIAAYYFPYNPYLFHTTHHIIDLSDGDKIVISENLPETWSESQRIILLIHGLTGSDHSKYVVRTARLLLSHGYRVIRMNLRGCGKGQGLAKHLYHSGRSEDTRAVLRWLKQKFPNSPVTQIGYSLGANITLKMAGEDGSMVSGNLDSLIVVSPPLDLYTSVKLIIKNKLFNQYFIKGLLRDVHILHQTFPDLPPLCLPPNINVYEFDDLYTAPRSGFKNAYDYYTRCSSAQFVENVTLPTFFLYAKDDPVIHRRKFLHLPKKENFDILITQKGGHVGWLGWTHLTTYRWMDHILLKWITWFESTH